MKIRFNNPVASAVLCVLIAACGGGQREGEAPKAAATAEAASSQEPRKQTLATTELLPFLERTAFFDEAEALFGVYFPGPQPTQTSGPYTYRYYPGTRNYLALTSTDIMLMGPVVGSLNVPVKYAALADFCGDPTTAKFCGSKLRRTLVVAGLEREFIVYQPWKSRHTSQLPVVFMLHGTSGDGQEFFDRSGWRELADSEGFIAVFPTALRHCLYEDDITVNGIFDANERRTPTKWASGILGDPSKMPLCTAAQIAALPADTRAKVDHPLADDLAFFDAMVVDLKQRWPVDAKRLYVSGFSNGGQMSGRLAAERSEVFAALAAAAGNAYTPLPVAKRPLSFVFTVGEFDDRFFAPLGLTALPLTDVGSGERFKIMLVRPHSSPQQLDDSRYSFGAIQQNGASISTYTYNTSLALPARTNTLYVGIVAGATHEYPNGSNHPLKMAELLWEFFKTRSLP